MDTKQLAAAELAAMAATSKAAKERRGELQPGTHDVDVSVRIRGRIVVGEDVLMERTSKPKAERIAALILARFGPRKRRDIVDEILAEGDDAPTADENLVEHLMRGLSSKSPATKAGNVTPALTIETL